MKGVFTSAPHPDVTEKLVSRIPQLCAETGVQLFVMHELIPTNKMVSIPNNATAHIRGARINVLISSIWDSKDPDILDAVRNAANELAGIVVQGEKVIPESLNVGYGNYSKHRVGRM